MATNLPITQDSAADQPAAERSDQDGSLIARGLTLARKPVEFMSLVGIITLAGYAGIEMARSDFQAGAVAGLGAVALLVLLIARLKKVI
jgi:hypothetical protein